MTETVLAIVIVLGVLIFIHELGHFLFARIFGVGVEKFSLGFGPRVVGKQVGMTDYRLSAIPLGGYVKMVGEEPDVEIEPEDIPYSFTHKHVFKRICIVAAGPGFNFLLAVAIFWGSFWVTGIEHLKPVIRAVEADSPAAKAGFRENDIVVAIDEKPVEKWADIGEAVSASDGKRLAVTVKRDLGQHVISVEPEPRPGRNIFGEMVEEYSIGVSALPVTEPLIGDVVVGTPANKAGLSKGDRIQKINGVTVNTWNEMTELISSSEGKTLALEVLRDGALHQIEVTPEHKVEKNILGEKTDTYRIGIAASLFRDPDAVFTQKLNLLQAFGKGFEYTWHLSKVTVIGIGKMIVGDISPKELGGPIIIGKMAGAVAKEGFDKLLHFIGFLSINLTILNILPIPVLDGGHLFFFLIEAVQGRPVSLRVREVAQQCGLVVLLMLMVFAIYNDIMRFF